MRPHLRFVCRSNSTMQGVGVLIGLNGRPIDSPNSIFTLSDLQAGELKVAVNQTDLTASEQGVYTCCIPLQSGEKREISIGIYPSTFSSKFCVL